VAEGLRADLNVIDMDALHASYPYVTYDLPLGGRRLLQRVTGYEATLLNGQVTHRNGEPTGAKPGRLVRAGRKGATRDTLALCVCPRHIALLGVSRDENSLTARPAMYAATFGSRPRVTVIKADAPAELHGSAVRPSLADLDDSPDVAMVMVPADAVIPTLEQCVDAGVKGAVVISSGFEDGDGAARRSALTRFLAAHPDFRLVGPNCVGVTSPAADCWLSFSSVLRRGRPLPGNVGLVTQSGAVGNGLFLALQQRGVGLAHWVSTGNELDLGALEAAADMLVRPECNAVGLFLEGITDHERRGDLAEAIAATGKPVVALR